MYYLFLSVNVNLRVQSEVALKLELLNQEYGTVAIFMIEKFLVESSYGETQ